MEEGSFRQDLYYRLSTFTFHLPPLRERPEDIPLLLQHFIDKMDADVKIEPEAFSCLCDYSWPGNIRELENEVKKMVLLAGDSKVIARQLVSRRIVESWNGVTVEDDNEKFSLYDYISRLERDYIVRALQQHKWVKKHAAESLSIPESTLRLKMKQYSISKSTS
jgi:transcriptional regulator with PAS, ATPase and Fis domain